MGETAERESKRYAFFQNRDCPYFCCHAGIPEEDFNCLFCYCPLYALGDACGGSFTYTQQGIKSCAGCTFPHRREQYGELLERLRAVQRLAARPPKEEAGR